MTGEIRCHDSGRRVQRAVVGDRFPVGVGGRGGGEREEDAAEDLANERADRKEVVREVFEERVQPENAEDQKGKRGKGCEHDKEIGRENRAANCLEPDFRARERHPVN